MKIPQKPQRGLAGLTLIELTVTVSILLTLVAVLFIGGSAYASQADKASCVMAQDQLRKSLVSDANMSNRRLEHGVDYYSEALSHGLIEEPVTCPLSGGGYTAMLEEGGSHLVITCIDHGDTHR